MLQSLGLRLFELGYLPDVLIRKGIRTMCQTRLNQEYEGGIVKAQQRLMDWVETLRQAPVAQDTDAANEQHYEVPASLYKACLGAHLKYSCALYDENPETTIMSLDEAEKAMLEVYCERGELENGQRVLELGCGWGSFTLFYAEKYPNSEITGVSNSNSQREYIMAQAKQRNLTNIQILTADVNAFDGNGGDYDRIVSIEMFEHVRNYRELLRRAATWLRNGQSKLFIHIFTHRECAYPYEDKGEGDWMARNFFSGGQMPSTNLLLYFQEDVLIEQHWKVNGKHYQRTCEDWLRKFDDNAAALIRPVLVDAYGADEAPRRERYWRVFFMACAELFGANNGEEWFVSHYRFRKRV